MHAYISSAIIFNVKLCMTKIIGIIPARFGSTRFPGKPLVLIQGKTMIQRVWEQAKKASSLAEVIVATDDKRIAEEVFSFGGNAIMTQSIHPTGTDRCKEALEVAESTSGIVYDAAINIQGDEPFIDPAQIDLVASCFGDSNTELATLVKRLYKTEDLFNPNIIKVVLSDLQEALYFSRSPIPYFRGENEQDWLSKGEYYKHIGIYGYRSDILRKVTLLPQGKLEITESLEQLRWLQNGYKIKTRETLTESRSVDAPEDLKYFEG
jgi:3-deoxy-manno-octulosonate cytidylyltransferase (CMP-KDO synthetase)